MQTTRLLALVDAAARRGLVVDLTFHREAVICPSSGCTFSVEDYGESLAALAWVLRDRRNVLFVLQNEWNVRSGGLTAPDLVALRERVRAANPLLPVAASVTADYGERDAVARAFDMVAWHGWRDAYGSWAVDTEAVVSRLRDAMDGRGDSPLPIYLQEPNRFPHAEDRQPWLDDTAAHYWLAARYARRAGGAAWTFHTAAGFHLGNEIPFAQLLLPGEQRVLGRLAAELAAEPAWGIRTPVDGVADVTRADDILQED